MVAWATKAVPADYAKFAPAVFAHARRGDALAHAIVTETAEDATMLIDRLLSLGASRIAMFGGVFPQIRLWLPERVGAYLVEPKTDAVDGAIRLAERALAGREPQSVA
jgi:glucosamine kinase